MTPDHPERLQPLTLSAPEILATYRRGRALNGALAAVGLTLLQAAVLAWFAEQPEATITMVAKTLGIASSVATGSMDELEKRGLARRLGRPRFDSSVDRRTVLIEVTEHGRGVLNTLAEMEIKP